MAELVCTDADETNWTYDPETERYSRERTSGEPHKVLGMVIARLHGRDIPNPDKLWQDRCEVRSVSTSSIEGAKLRPSPATYALYNHWQGVNNANDNS